MVLTIDIGNTYIGIGLFDRGGIKERTSITTPNRMTSYEARELILRFRPDALGLASVVPSLINPFVAGAKELDLETVLVSYESRTGLKYRYHDPSSIGSDRIANAVGGLKLYKENLIIIDFGTATTFDVVLKDGTYLGGIICPGIESGLESLSRRAALIPEVELKVPENVIGRNTTECIQSGIIFTTIGQINEILKRIKKESGEEFKVIATGGWGRKIVELTSLIDHFDPDLTLRGIYEIYLLNQKS
ncbi:MAG TPA: type III pantothenate kinase [bacterium (Candidatus Stahlbacteria)]|nr:type III pantothenate kinase [Candidatus Stahlbacteria bacterium]